MRRKGRVFSPVVISYFRISVLTLFLFGSVLFISGCQKQDEEIARRPPPTPTPQCTAIDPPPFINQTAFTQLGRGEVCVPVGECVATQVDTENKMAGKYCERNHSTTCSPGTCSSGSCKPEFDLSNSARLHIRSCAAGAPGPPGCAAGEELCKCDLSVGPMGKLDCDCGCR